MKFIDEIVFEITSDIETAPLSILFYLILCFWCLYFIYEFIFKYIYKLFKSCLKPIEHKEGIKIDKNKSIVSDIKHDKKSDYICVYCGSFTNNNKKNCRNCGSDEFKRS